MQVIKGDKFAYFDVDDTLVMWDYEFQKHPDLWVNLQEPWGGLITLLKNPIAISAIIDAKERGETVVIWSQSGWDWCQEVVNKLGLTDFVDVCISKPNSWYDDVPAERMLGTRIDLGNQFNKKYKGK